VDVTSAEINQEINERPCQGEGVTTATVFASVTDAESPVSDLRVRFTYVEPGSLATQTVDMVLNPASGLFEGTLGPFLHESTPDQGASIRVDVSARDPHQNAAGPVSTTVTLTSCEVLP
jgi:hypothetical protein